MPAQCEMSEWSLWGPCSKKKKLCGFRKGSEERTRRVLHAPWGDHTTCSDTKETRKCTVRRTPCPDGELQPLPLGVQPPLEPSQYSQQSQMESPPPKTSCCPSLRLCPGRQRYPRTVWQELKASVVSIPAVSPFLVVVHAKRTLAGQIEDRLSLRDRTQPTVTMRLLLLLVWPHRLQVRGREGAELS